MWKKLSKPFWGVCALTGMFWLSACSEAVQVAPVELIPVPEQIRQGNDVFVLKNKMVVGYAGEELAPAATYLAGMLSRATGYTIQTAAGEGDICLSLQPQLPSGGYQLEATRKQVTFAGNGYSGVIAGIETLRQLFPASIESN